jgi:beta-galactosidase GanA
MVINWSKVHIKEWMLAKPELMLAKPEWMLAKTDIYHPHHPFHHLVLEWVQENEDIIDAILDRLDGVKP